MKISQEELRNLLHYTGIFTNKVDRGPRAKAGDICNNNGYLIGKQTYLLHRLYIEGYIPVDHRDDNRWCNLRHVSRACNVQNQKSNSSGVPVIGLSLAIPAVFWGLIFVCKVTE